MSVAAEEPAAILAAYKRVMDASWPGLHPGMAEHAKRWPMAGEGELKAELAAYLQDASRPDCPVRIFWKLGDKFVFGGCNAHFARDAGMAAAADLIGLDDFDRKLPWVLQAAKYRADDEQVYHGGVAKLDILERQKPIAGITWVRAGKAPIRTAAGAVIGVLGMYEVLDPDTGRKLFAERNRKQSR